MRLAFWKKNKDNPNKKKKSALREWLDAAIFALIAATIIRTFFFEAFNIPTESMEGTLLVNDYMFVSKMSYGARMPMTPLSLPLVHNTMPIFGGKSYSEVIKWKYRRLPGFRNVERNDIVVFNFPNNDTTMTYSPANDYYRDVRDFGRDAVWSRGEIITRPVDKRENYIKRCVGIPGDVLEIKNGIVYINGAQEEILPHMRHLYKVEYTDILNINEKFQEEYGEIKVLNNRLSNSPNVKYLYMERRAYEKIKTLKNIVSIEPADELAQGIVGQRGHLVFPHNAENFPWNGDWYGPITIPKKGETITLTMQNYYLYERIIRIYEGNEFAVNTTDSSFIINNEKTNQYTFQMDYYWMMGDNRNNSLDSRWFGFVPEDHIVGTPAFVWLSYSKKGIGDGIRWNRLFKGPKSLER